ncbi:hypothetical protein [Methanoplanus limicola]|nr:hypothetical protein [Methanoplanus limicola]
MSDNNINEKGSVLADLPSPRTKHPLKISESIDRCRKLKSKFHPVKTPAVILGMSGAALVAVPAAAAHLAGFTCWIIANGLWVWHGTKVKDFYIMLLFVFYLVTAFMGIMGLLPEVI